MRASKNDSFEKFYYDKVGLGEGCGCAERIIDVHEFNRLAGGSGAGQLAKRASTAAKTPSASPLRKRFGKVVEFLTRRD
ncbi:hypothetical protein [Salaquimonas pukyongi]|uniref:hypothetical protein n=1 Tax=Salaquimonas pukyongi TaxID=2712698 RepID=UPI00096B7888|nr:hypothetical protein [Salaquimonas pukyongi]